VGDGGSACTAQTQDILPTVDGLSGALTTVGLVRALPLPPIAALTTGGAVNAPAGTLAVSILSVDDGGFGLTVYAGGAVSPGALAAGADALLERENEAPLQALAVAPNELWFRSMFGQDRATFQRQPAVVRVDCAAGCTRANLNNVLAGYPRNPIWVDGNLDLDSVAPAPAIGSAAEPVMLIVTGQLTVSANVQITGFVHANSINWAAAAGGATVSGAMVSATTFTAQGVATLAYNWQVLDTIRLHYGSFVRAPGSWNLIFR
jgi:hypothetical protein